MPRITPQIGTRFQLNEIVFEIIQILFDGEILAANVSFGGDKTFTWHEIAMELGKEHLRFEVFGKNTIAPSSRSLRTSYRFSDFSMIEDRYRIMAWERYQIIKPLVGRPRTILDVKLRIDEVYNNNVQLEIYTEKVGFSTVYRWIKYFEKSHGDIRSLVPGYLDCRRKGKSKLCAELDKIIAKAITNKYLTPERGTLQSVLDEVEEKLDNYNRLPSSEIKLKLPSLTTIWNKTNQLDPKFVAECRYGKIVANEMFKEVYAGGPQKYTQPLEAVYIDHSVLDLFLVDENDGLPIGRPYLTYSMDATSHYPLGFYCGFIPPSYASVSECLYHSILPKNYMNDIFPEIKEPWLAYGLPEKIICDNAGEFHSASFEDAAKQLGILIEYGRPHTPEDKAEIERFFKTLNTILLHRMPGTTFSNILERKDYDPKQNAVISLQDFEYILHIFFTGMASKAHSQLNGLSPAKVWEIGCIERPPALHCSAEELYSLLGAIDYRTITNKGIQFYELYYQSSELAELRLRVKNDKVRFKYHPNDISYIRVWDDYKMNYIKVPCTDQEYTKGLSLWKHRIILGVRKRNMKEMGHMRWLEARKMIEDFVSRIYGEAKKTGTRKRLARFIENESKVFKALRDGHSQLIKENTDDNTQTIVLNDQTVEILGYETDSLSLEPFIQSDKIDPLPKKPGRSLPPTITVNPKFEAIPNLDGWS